LPNQSDQDNPWRTDPDWGESDPSLKEFDKSALGYKPRLFFHLGEPLMSRGLYGIVTLRGPRRIGKTTLVKLLIRELLENGVGRNSIRYYSLDRNDTGGHPLSPLRLIEGTPADTDGDNFLFLDEVSFYDGWATELKNAFDAGLIDNRRLKVVATGSHSMDLSEAVSKLRGRQGPISESLNLGGNLLQAPLRFPEVVDSLQPEIQEHLTRTWFRKPKTRFACLLQLKSGEIPPSLEYIYDNYFQLLNGTLDDYLVHGGYPHAIDEFNKKSPRQVSANFYSTVAELLISDCRTVGLEPENLSRLVQFLIEPMRISNEFSLRASEQVIVRGEEGLPSGRFEKRRYLDYLRTTWSFFFAYPEERPCVPNYQELQKDYVLDPFLYHALYCRVNNIADPFRNATRMIADPAFKGRIVESVIASHLLLSQFLFEHIPSVDYERVLMFQRTSAGENDFALCLSKNNTRRRFVLESKFSSNPAHFNRIPEAGKIVITKDKFERRENAVLIPASVFLLLF